MPRDNYVQVRVSEEEKSYYRQLASEEGVPLTEWLRKAAEARASVREQRRQIAGDVVRKTW